MRRTPEINAWWDEAAQEIVYKDAVNLGIAAATPRGLVVPNVKDADLLDLVGPGDRDQRPRRGRPRRQDAARRHGGGSFTITNVGVFGVDSGTPIINPGESAIIAFGAVEPQPWVHEGEIKVRDVTTLALSFDHRFIDGEKGSRFLADVAAIMEDPAPPSSTDRAACQADGPARPSRWHRLPYGDVVAVSQVVRNVVRSCPVWAFHHWRKDSRDTLLSRWVATHRRASTGNWSRPTLVARWLSIRAAHQ